MNTILNAIDAEVNRPRFKSHFDAKQEYNRLRRELIGIYAGLGLNSRLHSRELPLNSIEAHEAIDQLTAELAALQAAQKAQSAKSAAIPAKPSPAPAQAAPAPPAPAPVAPPPKPLTRCEQMMAIKSPVDRANFYRTYRDEIWFDGQ